LKTANLGIEIGGTKLQVVAGDAQGKLLARKRRTVERSSGAAGIQRNIAQALAELARDFAPQAIGVGFGGPVDWRTGRIARSHQIEGWSSFDLRGWLEPLTGARVTVDNDANVAALGEALHGAGVGANPVFYVTLGSGVGGGLVVDGAIYHGATPGESEIGHVRLDRQGTIVESRCSGWAVDLRLRQAAKEHPDSALARRLGGVTGGEARHLAEALADGDEAARRILNETAADLVFGLSHVVHLFHPEMIVLGGGLSAVGEPLRAVVESALRELLMEVFRPGPQIRLSALGEDAVPVGALALAHTHALLTPKA
jgi:glucokinase